MADVGGRVRARVQRGRSHSAFDIMGHMERLLMFKTMGWLGHGPRHTAHIRVRIAAELEFA